MYNNFQIKLVSNILKKNITNYWTGSQCKRFETEFSKFFGNKYSVAVSNGSVALEIAIRALNLKKGDEIIVTPRSFIISASCVLNVGLKPVFADIDNNGNLSAETISKVFNKKVKAIILVHLNGQPCDMDPIMKFIKKKKIYLIEDCSQAHGAKYKKKYVGSFGHLATWSFCQDKIISTGGEGGMISTNFKNLWKKCWSYKDHGKNYNNTFFKRHEAGFRWVHDELGSNYRMTEMQATLGRYQLKNLNKQLSIRSKVANLYINGLKDFWIKSDILKKPLFYCNSCPVKNNHKKKCNLCTHSYYRINFFINSKKLNQIKLIKEFGKEKITCLVGSCPEIYREKVFRKLNIGPKKRLPNARLIGTTSLTFPINPSRKFSSINKEIQNIKKILTNYL